MTIPRPRLTVRRLLIVVALIACAFAADRMRLRRQYCLDKAEGHAAYRRTITRTPADVAYWEFRWADQRSGQGASYPWPAGPPFVPAIVKHHTVMEERYRRAARYPWLSIPTEASPPE